MAPKSAEDHEILVVVLEVAAIVTIDVEDLADVLVDLEFVEGAEGFDAVEFLGLPIDSIFEDG